MFERFTHEARQTVVRAQEVARRMTGDHIGDEHLLLGLLAENAGVATTVLADLGVTADAAEREAAALRAKSSPLSAQDAQALEAIGINLDEIRRRVEETFGPGALDRTTKQRKGHLPFNQEAKQVLQTTIREASELHHNYLGPEHILLALSRLEDGNAVAVLRALNVQPDVVRSKVHDVLRRAS